MKKVLECNQAGTLKLVESTLTDESKVYDVYVGDQIIVCHDQQQAEHIFGILKSQTIISAR